MRRYALYRVPVLVISVFMLTLSRFLNMLSFNTFNPVYLYIDQYHKFRICLRGLYSRYTYDIPDL